MRDVDWNASLVEEGREGEREGERGREGEGGRGREGEGGRSREGSKGERKQGKGQTKTHCNHQNHVDQSAIFIVTHHINVGYIESTDQEENVTAVVFQLLV